MGRVIEILKAILDSRWIGYVILGVVALLLLRQCNARKGAEDALAAAQARAEEAEAEIAAGIPVFQPVDEGALNDRIRTLEASNATLLTENDKLRKAVPSVHPVGTVEVTTEPVVVSGEGACLVAPGQSLQLKVGEILWEGKAKSHTMTGVGEVLRTSPGDPVLILRQPFSAPVTEAMELTPEAPPVSRWGLGPAGHCAVIDGKVACGLGAAGVIPLTRHFDLILDVTALGMPSAGAAVLWRP